MEEYIDTGGTFPVVVKSADPLILRQRPQATSVVIADTPEELLDIYDTMEDFSAPNLMLQEFIPGGPETVWMFNGYFDAQSDCLFAVLWSQAAPAAAEHRPDDAGEVRTERRGGTRHPAVHERTGILRASSTWGTGSTRRRHLQAPRCQSAAWVRPFASSPIARGWTSSA